MIRLTKLFVERPTLAFVVVALAMLGGFLAWRGLVRQQYPNVALPTINISYAYSGASPQTMLDSVVRPFETHLNGTPYLQDTSVIVEQGTANISASFALSSSLSGDLVNTEKAIAEARQDIPSTVVSPTVSESNPSEAPVIHFGVSSRTLSASRLAQIVTYRIVPQIEQVSGVSTVDVTGDATPAFVVHVDPNELAASGHTLNDVVATLAANNVRAPGGFAYERNRQTSIVVRGNITTPASIANLPLTGGTAAATSTPGATQTGAGPPSSGVAQNPWSQAIALTRLGDVATVVLSHEPQQTFAYVDGKQSIRLDVRKITSASEVAVSDSVVAALPALERRFPQVRFTTIEVESSITKRNLDGVIRTLIEGIALIAVVMILFLASWRNAAIVLVTIPASLGVTLFVMQRMKLTLDTISLLAMTLVIGILIDSATVMLENIERHRSELDAPPKRAAVEGIGEISTAAVVLTLVDVVVFLPIAFLSGPIGRELAEFGIVVTIATLTSLFVSFTVTPAMSAAWGLKSTWTPPRPIRAFEDAIGWLRDRYAAALLPWSLAHRWLIVAIAAVTFGGAVALLPTGMVGETYIPPQNRGEIFVQFQFPTGTPLATTRHYVLAMQNRLLPVRAVRSVVAVAGGFDTPYGPFVQENSVGEVHLFLRHADWPQESAWVSRLRTMARRVAPDGHPVVIPATGTGGGQVQPIDELVSLAGGGDPSGAAQRVFDAARRVPGITNLSMSARDNAPVVTVTFDRARARLLGVSVGSAATAVEAAFGGAIATQVESKLGIVYVDVMYPLARRHDLSAINAIPLRTKSGSVVHVGDVADIRTTPAPPIITQDNGKLVVHVNADVQSGFSLSNVQKALNVRITALHLPRRVTVTATPNGQQQHMQQTLSALGSSLVLSVVLVFLLMVALYNSFRAPLIILFSIPVAAVGGLGALWVTHETLNLFSLIGSLLLVGLVTKNGILLVDYANTLRAQGADRYEAIVESGKTRFRPILMTTVAMVVALVPLALAIEPGSHVRRSLGTIVIGGLTSSLLLTLVLVPVMYLWLAPKHVKARPEKQPRGSAPSGAPEPAATR